MPLVYSPSRMSANPPISPTLGALTRRNTNPFSHLPPLRILIAPSGFKESLSPESIANSIAAGIQSVVPPHSLIQTIPLHDGGEGFSKALASHHGGHIVPCEVTGPVGEPIQSYFGIMELESVKMAVVDMAAAAGLRLVPIGRRDPTRTTTYGVGELIKKALDLGCEKVIVGCGDSGTSDGGAGMLQALGVRLLDGEGKELPKGGGGRTLVDLKEMDWDSIHPRLRGANKVPIEAVCNIKNVLCGSRGVAQVYGPQKGASASDVALLLTALSNYASVASAHLNCDISTAPGSGASGGLGTGLLLIGGTLLPRHAAINFYFGLDSLFQRQWDIVFTAEGSIDYSSTQGKMTTEIATRAKQQGAQVVALAGTIGKGAETCYGVGIGAFMSILKAPISLEKAIGETERLVREGAERAMRMIIVGMELRLMDFRAFDANNDVDGAANDLTTVI